MANTARQSNTIWHSLVATLLVAYVTTSFVKGIRHTPSLIKSRKPYGRKLYAGTFTLEEARIKALRKQNLNFALRQLFVHPQSVAALHTLRQLADEGDSEGHFYLGFMYSFGLGGLEQSHARAFLHYSFAAIGDNAKAQMALAYRYFTGRGVAKNCETALDLYRRVAALVEKERVRLSKPALPPEKIRLTDEFDDPSNPKSNHLDRDLLQYYQFLADKGDVKAQVGLGQLLFQGGRNVPPDHMRAFRYLTRATGAGDSNAMALLGKMYFEGSQAVAQSNETALKYFSMAAEKGNAFGQTGLAKMYRLGSGVPVDYAQALRLLKMAADQGFIEAHVELGNMFYFGLGVEKNYPIAFKYFQQALMQGHTSAFYYLGLMNGQGTGVVRNCRNAVDLLKEVAERGSWSSQLSDAYQAHADGRKSEAVVRYMFLAEIGSEVAQSNAAHVLFYSKPNLFSDNVSLALALRFWQMAASQGSASARLKLGDAYFYGLGMKVDHGLAVQYYRDAGEDHFRPSAQALFNLGVMHEYGQGVAQDLHLARRYYHLAATVSEDAQVPVHLALFKMYVLERLRNLLNLRWIESGVLSILGEDWDLYMMIALAVVIVTLAIVRHFLPRL
ncbi:protein sel-11-like [Tropilaelaps mercedesae]|uniref:Protein sel-11-like n=1 Tax=Tropilaelaps mercedesae TaxID=418985 RepID=A0A1V9XQF3_9ACAR|nr:protein sel-11-like [Tropilaelaps mercedesae]